MPDEIGTLFHTASTPTMSVDPYAVLAGGRRRRRRRALTAVVGTAAAALVLGGGGWALLADRAGDDRTLPAATTSPSPFVPATLDGPTTEVPLGAIPPTGRTVPVVVSVTLDDARSRLGFTLRSEDGTVLAAQTVGESRTERHVTYLPPVEDVELVTTGDARVRDLAVHDFGDVVGLLVVADVEGSRESVTEVRFTDPEFGPTGGPAPAG